MYGGSLVASIGVAGFGAVARDDHTWDIYLLGYMLFEASYAAEEANRAE